MRDKQQIVIQAVGLRNQLVEVTKLGGEQFLAYLVQHSFELVVPVLQKQATDAGLVDDLAILSQYVKFTDESASEKAVTLALFYLTKGVPASLINESDKKNTISPMISPSCNKEQLLAVIKAALSLEMNEEDYQKRVLTAEVTKDGIYSKCRQLLLSYRASIMAT